MTPTRQVNYSTGTVVSASWLNRIQEVLAPWAANLNLTSTATSVTLTAGTEGAVAAVSITGHWRWIEASQTLNWTGGDATGEWGLWVVTSADDTAAGFTFTRIAGTSTPAGAFVRKIGTVSWSGSALSALKLVSGYLTHAFMHADGAPDALTVTSGMLATDSVTAAKIAAGAVGTSELATDAVDASKIAAGAVGSSEIATDAVGSDEIAAGAVGSSELATKAVTGAKLADELRNEWRIAGIQEFRQWMVPTSGWINAGPGAEYMLLSVPAIPSGFTREWRIHVAALGEAGNGIAVRDADRTATTASASYTIPASGDFLLYPFFSYTPTGDAFNTAPLSNEMTRVRWQVFATAGVELIQIVVRYRWI